jgi:hypothetical protein
MPSKIENLVGTSSGFTNLADNDAEVNTYISDRGWTPERGWQYYDSTHAVLKQWDGAAWVFCATAGVLLVDGSLAGATAQPQTFGSGVTTDAVIERTAGEGVAVAGIRYFGSSATDPTPGTPATAGDTYYNTALDMEMRYDGLRSKWLSTETVIFWVEGNGLVGGGTYYMRGSLPLNTTTGFALPYNSTIVAVGAVRVNALDIVLDFLENTVSRTTLSMPAAPLSKVDTTKNVNLSADSVLAVRMEPAETNQSSGLIGWAMLRWRV